MINSNELMRGNWLYYRGQFNAFPFRVEQITKKKVGYHAEPGENRMHYLRLNEEVQPIPLTAELLEKNGFEKIIPNGYTSPQQEYVLAGDYEDVYAEEINDGTWKIDVDCTEFDLPRQTAMISYLHQLQNWFRLCGIEREIIAF